MLRAIIFDFDGLILDTELPEFTAWCEIFEAQGHELPLEIWQAAIGTRDGFDPYSYLSGLTGRTIDRDVTRSQLKHRARELIEALEPLPGVESLLVEAREFGLSIGLASSSDREGVEAHLGRLSLDHHFDAVVCASSSGLPAKPDAAVYVEALRALDVRALEAVALEDSLNGVRAAKAAGIHCIAVPNTVTRSMDFSEADSCITSLLELSLTELATRF